MPKIGVHAHLWINKWTTESGNQAIQATAEAGFDLIEIPLKDPETFDAPAHRKALEAAGIEAVASLALPEECHMPANPNGAVKFLTKVLQKLRDTGGSYLCGPLACASDVFTGAPPTREERATVVDALGEVARAAEKMGMRIGLEVLNRNSTYLYNTLADARETILAIGMDNLSLHADTYHMNFEENSFYEPLVECADVLGYMHMVENHRGLIGSGTIRWDAVFRGLKEANYSGPLVLESFTPFDPKFLAAYKLWRDSGLTPKELAKRGLAFLKENAVRYGL